LEADLRRAKKLLPTHAISQEEFDKEEGDRNEADATVKAAEAARNSAKVNLEYTTVRAKFAGRISRQMIDPGNMVKEKETALTTLVSTDKMYIYFDVDERTAIAIRKLIDEGKMTSPSGIAINYALADEEGYPRTANVNFVDNQINMATGTWRLRALIEKPDPCLLPNMFLRVRVPIGQPYDTLLVAERALGSDQGQKFLYVINGENKAEYRQVVCGPLLDQMRAITSGVGPKDRIVVNGLQRIRGGQLVAPQEEKKKVDAKKEEVKKDKQVAAQAAAQATPTAVR
jgi:RND family efflux transporter MFP subunit